MQQNSTAAADRKSDVTAANDNSREYEIANTTERHFIVRTIVFACRQLLRLVQYSIHTMLDRLILSENNSQSSSSSANDLRYYTIQFTTRDVTSSFILLYTWMKINAWLKCENEIVSVLGLMLTFGIVFRRQLSCVDDEIWHHVSYRVTATPDISQPSQVSISISISRRFIKMGQNVSI